MKLPQYFQLFMDQGIEDLESVGDITMNDLKEMGIDMIGHRNKIMKYARQLNQPNKK